MNDLGVRIGMYREKCGLSQLELSEMLEVSRQAISKWETGVAQPELPKLVKMAEIFGVSLDELVLGKAKEPEKSEPLPDIIKEEKVLPKKEPKPVSVTKLVMGAVFAVLGCLLSFILLGFGAYSAAVTAVILFGLCAFFCLKQCEHAALWCFDTWFVFLVLYFNYATGLSWGLVFNPLLYSGDNNIMMIMSWAELLLAVGAFVMQIFAFRKKEFVFSIKKNVSLAVSCALLFALKIAAGFLFPVFWLQIVAGGDKQRYYEIYRTLPDLMVGFEFTVEVALLIGFTACLVPTFYWIISLIRARKKEKSEK